MTSPEMLSRQGHRLLQVGVALFLFTSFQGFTVPYFTAPTLGRSVHTLSAFSGVLLLALGLLWPKLNLRLVTSRIAFWFLIYSDFATVASFLMRIPLDRRASFHLHSFFGACGRAIDRSFPFASRVRM